MERNTWRGNDMSDLREIATLCNKAGNEIERLRKEIDYLTTLVDTLLKQRDEARRQVCYERRQNLLNMEFNGKPAHKCKNVTVVSEREIAVLYFQWFDCFKEAK